MHCKDGCIIRIAPACQIRPVITTPSGAGNFFEVFFQYFKQVLPIYTLRFLCMRFVWIFDKNSYSMR